jgi:PAS domain S-box-containing protein
VEALRAAAASLGSLAAQTASPAGADATVARAADLVNRLMIVIPRDVTLTAVLPLRPLIMEADQATRAVDEEFVLRDEQVVQDAIASAIRQKREVTAALVISAVLTIWFVLATRRRLRARLDRDIAAERNRRAEVETMSVRFAMATRAARAGVYELTRDGLDVWWSDTMYEVYGRTADSFRPTLDAWLELIHRNDREAAREAIAGAMRECKPLRSQHRVLRPDGSVCHVASLAAVVSDPHGGGVRLVGIDLDITARVEAEERERDLQLKLRDLSRRAGMAEIATNVLHNVGNVLNSVNISAGLVADRVKDPRVSGLGKVAALLREHQADLGVFVTADQRGRHLPDYLTQMSEHLAQNQSMTLQELDLLRRNVDHIKEIVAMQQSYSKLVGVPEKLAVASLVDDALRMNTGAFSRHGVRLNCAFEEVPPIVVEKHKVLQILINLLRNAKYACDASGRTDKEVTVSIAGRPDGVRITVADNGIGIEPANLKRIFSHGFTTKKDGHGFGLHGGALAARDLGGSLRVESGGPGLGATFTLDLPWKAPETLTPAERLKPPEVLKPPELLKPPDILTAPEMADA